MQQILSEFHAPSRDGLRMPTYPDLQRTGLYPQLEEGTLSLTRNPTRVALIRDPTFPLWADMPGAFYAFGWSHVGPNLDELSVGPADTEEISLTDFTLSDPFSGTVTATSTRPGMIGTFLSPPASVLANVFPEIDERPWMWVPNGWTINVVGTFGSAPTITGSLVDVIAVLEVRNSAEDALQDYELPLGDVDAAHPKYGASMASAALSSAARTGVFVRLRSLRLLGGAAGVAVVGYSVRVALVATATNLGQVVTTGISELLPTIGVAPGGAPLAGFMPVVNLSQNRNQLTNAASIIAAAVKVVSTAIVFTNVTKVMNQEGTIQCCRFYQDSQYSLAVPPAAFSGFMPDDRAFLRMAAGVRTAVRPSSEFEMFQDYRVTYPTGFDARGFFAASRLLKKMHIHYMLFADPDLATTSSIAFSLRQNLEFITNDVLLRPGISPFSISALHDAVRKFANQPIWAASGRPEHYNLVDRGVRVPKPVKEKAVAPRPKAPQQKKAKPEAAAPKQKAREQPHRKS